MRLMRTHARLGTASCCLCVASDLIAPSADRRLAGAAIGAATRSTWRDRVGTSLGTNTLNRRTSCSQVADVPCAFSDTPPVYQFDRGLADCFASGIARFRHCDRRASHSKANGSSFQIKGRTPTAVASSFTEHGKALHWITPQEILFRCKHLR